MPGNGNGGGGGRQPGQGGGGGGAGGGGGTWENSGEGGRQLGIGGGGGSSWGLPTPEPIPPKYGEPGYVAKPGEKGFVREAKNVQRANIDRSSLYDPTSATQALGADYLQQRNASNPQPQGSTGAGAVGYDFTPSDERLY